jgi:hypothetical protein
MLLTMESKTAAAHKLELLIERGRAKAGEVLDHVMNNQPTDRMAKGGELVFTPSTDGSAVQIQYPDPQTGKIDQRLHRHATLQMAQTLDLPVKFIDSLQTTPKPWAQELLAHNLSTVFANRFANRRYLLRSVSGEVRGQGRSSVEALCWDLPVTEHMKGDFLIEFYGKTRILRAFTPSRG